MVEIARVYTDLVKLEKTGPDQEYHAKDLVNALRARCHEILMAKMREEGIDFSDRFDATNKAFELLHEEKSHSS